MKLARLAAFLALPLLLAGCSSFERDAFNSLSASKAVIDLAQADYTTGKIKETKCTYALINDAKAAQTTAVDGMLAYETVKAAKGDLAAQSAAVTVDIAAIVPLVAEIKVLYVNPSACKTGATS